MFDHVSPLVFAIEDRGGNPRFKTPFGIVRALSMDANDIFYSEMKHGIPIQMKLHTIFPNCSDSGAEMLYEACCTILSSVRKKERVTIE